MGPVITLLIFSAIHLSPNTNYWVANLTEKYFNGYALP
jgi:hypothetical protein